MFIYSLLVRRNAYLHYLFFRLFNNIRNMTFWNDFGIFRKKYPTCVLDSSKSCFVNSVKHRLDKIFNKFSTLNQFLNCAIFQSKKNVKYLRSFMDTPCKPMHVVYNMFNCLCFMCIHKFVRPFLSDDCIMQQKIKRIE